MMRRFLLWFMVALLIMIANTALAVSGECTYYAQNGDHDWNQVDAQMPSCTTDGYYVLKCNVCGTTHQEITEGAWGHDWQQAQVVDATCTKAGYIRFVCNECSEEKFQEISPSGHAWSQTAVVNGTCTSPSYIHYSCDNSCGDTKTDTIKAPGHTWKDLYEVQPATCTLAGTMKTECKVCGEVGTRIIEITEHDYADWVVTKAVDNGMCVRIRSCIVCGKQDAEEFYPDGTLYRGIQAKQAVKDLQTMLTDCGYLNDKVDGVFGKKTEQAVKAFQKEEGIGADGIAWPQTIGLLTVKWETMMGISSTSTPVPAPVLTPTPAATEEPVQEMDDSACCVRFENEDGSEEIVYCTDHLVLLEMCEALMNAATTNDSRTRALNQCRNLWLEEVDLLYAEWISVAEEADKVTIENGKAMFESYLASQEALWNMQYKRNPALAAEKVKELLIDQCVSICGIIGEMNKDQISTEKGFVSIELVDGWYVGEKTFNDSITLHNDAIGSSSSTWITVTDSQMGNGIEQAKQIATFAYVDAQFTETQIGENLFYYITNSDGTVFTLVAETSTGKAMKVDGRNCTLEQAMSLLETIEIR